FGKIEKTPTFVSRFAHFGFTLTRLEPWIGYSKLFVVLLCFNQTAGSLPQPCERSGAVKHHPPRSKSDRFHMILAVRKKPGIRSRGKGNSRGYLETKICGHRVKHGPIVDLPRWGFDEQIGDVSSAQVLKSPLFGSYSASTTLSWIIFFETLTR